MFHIGDRVIYGGIGVCDVADISTLQLDGVPRDRLYYILRPVGKAESFIYAPVENTRVVMRPILTREQALGLIAEIPALEPLPEGPDKTRETLYRDCIKSCDCRQLIRIIKTLWLRGRSRLTAGKKLSSLDERYLHQAEENLYAELGLALDMEKDAVGPYIARRMETLAGPAEN